MHHPPASLSIPHFVGPSRSVFIGVVPNASCLLCSPLRFVQDPWTEATTGWVAPAGINKETSHRLACARFGCEAAPCCVCGKSGSCKLLRFRPLPSLRRRWSAVCARSVASADACLSVAFFRCFSFEAPLATRRMLLADGLEAPTQRQTVRRLAALFLLLEGWRQGIL